MSDLTAVSLFAGIGGIDRALELAGVQVTAAVEIDPDCRGVLRRHFPGTAIFNDVTEVTGDQLRATGFVPERGVLTGGFPCQDLSVAGRRAGLDGARSGLFWEIVRLAAELRPKWLLLENVPGLISSKETDDDFRCVCGWPRGRRRLHLPSGLEAAESADVLPGDRDRHDGEGARGASVDAAPVRRAHLRDPRGDGSLECGSGMEGARAGGGGLPAGDPAASPAEVGAVPDGAEGSGDQGFAGAPGRPERGLDTGGFRALRDAEGGDPGAEPEGSADLLEAADSGGEASCPACGESVGDGPGRPVLGHGLGIVLGALADLGYGLAWRILDAQHFGVPQRRRRVFVVGCLGNGHAPVEVLLEPEGGDRDPAPSGKAWPGTAAAARRSAVSSLQGGGRRGHRIDAEGAAGGHLIAHALTAREGKGPDSDAVSGFICAPLTAGSATGEGVNRPGRRREDDTNLIAHALTSEGADASEDGTGRGTPLVAVPVAWRGRGMEVGEEGIANALRSAGDGHVGDQMGYVMTAAGFAENQRGEVVESAVSHQLTTGGGKPSQGYPAVRQESAVRRLTPLECERLQGFPDRWTLHQADGTEQSDSARYRQLGNSVAVPCVTWITRRMAAAEARVAAARDVA